MAPPGLTAPDAGAVGASVGSLATARRPAEIGAAGTTRSSEAARNGFAAAAPGPAIGISATAAETRFAAGLDAGGLAANNGGATRGVPVSTGFACIGDLAGGPIAGLDGAPGAAARRPR